jgi:hypothetical protein
LTKSTAHFGVRRGPAGQEAGVEIAGDSIEQQRLESQRGRLATAIDHQNPRILKSGVRDEAFHLGGPELYRRHIKTPTPEQGSTSIQGR